MRWESNRERAERKFHNTLKPMPEPELFACELVLADAPLPVQELLHSAMTHRFRQRFIGLEKQRGLKVSGPKARTQRVIPFKVAWDSRYGTYRRGA